MLSRIHFGEYNTPVSPWGVLARSPLQSFLRFGNNSKAYHLATPEDYLQMKHHAGWREGVDGVSLEIRDLLTRKPDARILEMGPGSGNATEILAKRFPQTPFVAIELDEPYTQFLRHNLATQNIQNVQTIQGDARTVRLPQQQKADMGFAVFSLTHLSEPERQEFYRNAREHLLKPGAKLHIVDEFLPDWVVKETPTMRTLGHFIHHGNIIMDALMNRHFKTAWLEHQAMWSGILGIADFKTSPRAFEEEVQKAGLVLSDKQQLYPLPTSKTLVPVTESGVYRYTLTMPNPRTKAGSF